MSEERNILAEVIGAERFQAHYERHERLILSPEEASRFMILMDEEKVQRIAALESEVSRLREALEVISAKEPCMCHDGVYIARAALAQRETP